MISPQPFFQFRGTPFSVRERLRALTELGHSVDLVTYHIGQHIDIPGVRIHRSFPIPFVEHVPIGPSWIKFLLDFHLALRTLLLLPFLKRVDLIHSHEEGAVIGLVLSGLLRKPHVYDMHSSLPQQLVNYNFTRSRIMIDFAEKIERWIVRRSAAVIVVCPWLEDLVRGIAVGAQVFLIENPPVCEPPGPEVVREAQALRERLQATDRDILLYTGTLEVNQGLEIILGAIPAIIHKHPNCLFLFVGGEPDQILALTSLAEQMGVDKWIHLTGQQPSETIPAFMHSAAALLSPRKVGQNTPLKIYSYLQSGRPIVATDLETHRQVLDESIALLVAPEPAAFAEGIIRILDDKPLAQTLGEAGRKRLEERYSWNRFLENTGRFCDYITSIT